MKADSSDYSDGLVLGRKRSGKAALAADAGDANGAAADKAAELACERPAMGGRLASMQNGTGPWASHPVKPLSVRPDQHATCEPVRVMQARKAVCTEGRQTLRND